MTLSANTVWEVRTSGSDNSGGGFVAGSGGTDYSQQDAAQQAWDGAANILSTSGAGSTTLISNNALFTAAMLGNIIQITAGTNFQTGFYQITTFTDSTHVILDRTPTSGGAGAAGVGAVGGALATIGKLAGAMVASNKGFVKAGAGYTTNATITFAQTAVVTNSVMPTRLIGYNAARTDAGRFTLTLQTNSGLTALALTGNGFFVENANIDCASLTTSKGISNTGSGNHFLNCKINNFTSRAMDFSGTAALIEGCEVTGGTSAATGAIVASGPSSISRDCWIHDNACPGLLVNGGGEAVDNLITNNTGAGSDGISAATNNGVVLLNNTIYGSGRDGINLQTRWYGDLVRNNILAKNGRFGLNFSTGAGCPAGPWWDGNGYWSNTSGTRNNVDDTATNPVNSAAPYTNVLDVVIAGTDPTNDPFTAKASGDFTLNATTGAGALLRGTGTPGAIAGVAQTGKTDFGCFQHPDPPTSLPPTPTLTVADKVDGTGATATIAGSDPASNNVIWTVRVDLLTPGAAPAWTNSGSRTGNGTVDLALAPGFVYWAYCASTLGPTSESPPVFFAVSPSPASPGTIEGSLFRRLLNDVTLAGLLGNRIAPWRQKQGQVFPNLNFRRISTERKETLNAGFMGLEGARIKLDFWSDVGEAQIIAIREALLRQGSGPSTHFLDGARGDWSGIKVQSCFVEDVGDSPDLPQHWDDTGLYGGSLDLMIWFEK